MPDQQAELIFGFVYGVGTNADPVVSLLKDYLKQFSYTTHEFRVSEHLRSLNLGLTFNPFSTFEEMNTLMTAGDIARERAKTNDILAIMAVNDIADQRKDERPLDGVAHLIRSLKTPEEVRLLREVYRPGFFLIGIACDDDEQRAYLKGVKGLTDSEVERIILRDQDEGSSYGQRTRDTFYLADVFVELTAERYKDQLDRFLELVFGHPFRTPTKDEHAMFMAYASGARSAQLGRQVGAAIATVEGDVAAVGFNEVPAAGGGPYWDGDVNDARDHSYDHRVDSNYLHRSRIVESIVTKLRGGLLTLENAKALLSQLGENSKTKIDEDLARITDLLITYDSAKAAVHTSELKEVTEYGRAVHAEMDAILACARLGISAKGKRLFTTTFPCHNCTRHIIAAGLSSVTYIEPYPKSRAADLHRDAICFDLDEAKRTSRIPFVPFIGVGPRRYLDLFSLDLSTGRKVERKKGDGSALFPKRANRPPRVPMLPFSYLERESKLLEEHEDVIKMLEGNDDDTATGQDAPKEQNSAEPPTDDRTSKGDR